MARNDDKAAKIKVQGAYGVKHNQYDEAKEPQQIYLDVGIPDMNLLGSSAGITDSSALATWIRHAVNCGQ